MSFILHYLHISCWRVLALEFSNFPAAYLHPPYRKHGSYQGSRGCYVGIWRRIHREEHFGSLFLLKIYSIRFLRPSSQFFKLPLTTLVKIIKFSTWVLVWTQVSLRMRAFLLNQITHKAFSFSTWGSRSAYVHWSLEKVKTRSIKRYYYAGD